MLFCSQMCLRDHFLLIWSPEFTYKIGKSKSTFFLISKLILQRQPDDSLFLHRYWSVKKKKRQLVSKKCFKKNNVISDEATLLIRKLESTWYIPGRSDTYILRASLTKIDNHDGHEMWFHMCLNHILHIISLDI